MHCRLLVVGVVAIADNTLVSFALPPTSNVSVTFMSRVYHSGEILTIVLDIYGTFQLQTSPEADLTGCRVYASNPIAVYSGNRVSQARNALLGHTLISHYLHTVEYSKIFAILLWDSLVSRTHSSNTTPIIMASAVNLHALILVYDTMCTLHLGCPA